MILIKRYQGIEIIHYIIFCFFLILLGVSSASAYAAGKGPAETLSVSVQVTVQWKDEVPSFHKNEGSLTLNIGGSLKLDSGGSPAAQKQNMTFMPVLTYRAQSLNVIYKYDETMTSLAPPPPKGCRDPVMFEFHGSGASQVVEGSSLNIRYFSTMAAPYMDNLSPNEKSFLANMPGSPFQCDYYEFFTGGPYGKVTIPGTITKTEKDRCEYKATEKPLKVFRLGIRSALPKSGSMSGSKTWSADNRGMCPPLFGISVCDLPAPICPSPCHPPEGGKSNVTYSVSWNIGAAEEYILVRESSDSREKEREKECEKIREVLNNNQLIMKLYENLNVMFYGIDNFEEGGAGRDAYQQALENLFTRALAEGYNTPESIQQWLDGLDESEIQEAYETDPSDYYAKYAQSGTGGPAVSKMESNYREHSIDATYNNQSVQLVVYDENWENPHPTEYYWRVYHKWIDAHGELAGNCFFYSALAHEKLHMSQYSVQYPETINLLSNYELDAYQVENDKLEECLKELGC